MSKNHKKNGRNRKKTGEKRAIFPKRPFKTGMPVLKRATWEHCGYTASGSSVYCRCIFPLQAVQGSHSLGILGILQAYISHVGCTGDPQPWDP